MAKAKEGTRRGRPVGVYLTPEQVDVIAALLADAVTHLKDAAKFMRENGLPKIMIPAAKILDEHVPITSNFARKLYAEVGPAAAAFQIGRKTKIEHNQERGAKYRESVKHRKP